MITPTLKINNISLTQQDVSFALTPGVIPYRETIIVPSTINTRLRGLQNPVTLSFTCQGGDSYSDNRVFVKEFKNLYLTNPTQIDLHHWQWILNDVRFLFRGKKVYANYNKTRITNKRGYDPKSTTTTPASIRQPFDLFKEGRYLSDSVKENGSPYTVKEILYKELDKLRINTTKLENDDNSYIIENIVFEGDTVQAALNNLLARSRLDLGITVEGFLYIYSVDFMDENQITLLQNLQNTRATGPGRVYTSDYSRSRPKDVNIRFKKKQEIAVFTGYEESGLNYTDPQLPLNITDEDIKTGRAIPAVNVMQAPYTVGKLQVGEWVTVENFLNESTIDITDQEIRENFFGERLELRYIDRYLVKFGSSTQEEQTFLRNIAASIKKHYRTYFQLHPLWMDKIHSWSTTRVSVVDNYSHYNSPSPVYTPYTMIPTTRSPRIAKRTDLWTNEITIWNPDIDDPYRTKPTPASITIVNHELGIFAITMPNLIDMVYKKIYPFAINEDDLTANIAANRYKLSTATLTEHHHMDTIISVVWDFDNEGNFDSEKKYFKYTQMPEKPSFGPPVDVLNSNEYARYETRQVEPDGDAIKTLNDPEKPVNESYLNMLALTDSARIYNSYRDRITGHIELAGWNYNVFLTGHMVAIIFKITQKGLVTEIDLSSIPPARTLDQSLSQDDINYLRSQINKTDEVNTLK